MKIDLRSQHGNNTVGRVSEVVPVRHRDRFAVAIPRALVAILTAASVSIAYGQSGREIAAPLHTQVRAELTCSIQSLRNQLPGKLNPVWVRTVSANLAAQAGSSDDVVTTPGGVKIGQYSARRDVLSASLTLQRVASGVYLDAGTTLTLTAADGEVRAQATTGGRFLSVDDTSFLELVADGKVMSCGLVLQESEGGNRE